MDIEFEATFANIDKDQIRAKLKQVGAKLLRPEFLQKRENFFTPTVENGWGRVRDEGDKITLSVKAVRGDKIEDQKEVQLIINNFDSGVKLFETLGCKKKAYQESKRELWDLDGVEVVIDEWPFLEPFVEIESDSEEKVKTVADKLGFNYSEAVFGAVSVLYKRKYLISQDQINNHTPVLSFDMENPFINRIDETN